MAGGSSDDSFPSHALVNMKKVFEEEYAYRKRLLHLYGVFLDLLKQDNHLDDLDDTDIKLQCEKEIAEIEERPLGIGDLDDLFNYGGTIRFAPDKYLHLIYRKMIHCIGKQVKRGAWPALQYDALNIIRFAQPLVTQKYPGLAMSHPKLIFMNAFNKGEAEAAKLFFDQILTDANGLRTKLEAMPDPKPSSALESIQQVLEILAYGLTCRDMADCVLKGLEQAEAIERAKAAKEAKDQFEKQIKERSQKESEVWLMQRDAVDKYHRTA